MNMKGELELMDRQITDHLTGGETVIYRSGNLVEVELRSIFDNSFEMAPAGDVGVISSGPAVFARLSDLPSDPETDHNAIVFVNGVGYKINEPHKDGQGAIVLLLHQESS